MCLRGNELGFFFKYFLNKFVDVSLHLVGVFFSCELSAHCAISSTKTKKEDIF